MKFMAKTHTGYTDFFEAKYAFDVSKSRLGEYKVKPFDIIIDDGLLCRPLEAYIYLGYNISFDKVRKGLKRELIIKLIELLFSFILGYGFLLNLVPVSEYKASLCDTVGIILGVGYILSMIIFFLFHIQYNYMEETNDNKRSFEQAVLRRGKTVCREDDSAFI